MLVADKIVIDLTGPEGNHRTLVAYAYTLAKRHNLDETAIMDEMLDGGFIHMTSVFKKHFSEWATLTTD